MEPKQDHVPAEHRCPPISISKERASELATEEAALERVVDRLIDGGDLSVDPDHQARQASTEPVPFKLGPNTFALHRNFFYFQNAPSAEPSEGTVALSLQWPCMEPLPQGFDFADDRDTSMRAILISVTYLDRITPEESMRRSLLPLDPDDAAARADPLENLDLRIRGDVAHGGLTPYYADIDAVERYLREHHPNSPRAYSRENAQRLANDWYVRRGSAGDPLTIIKCDNRSFEDGLIVDGNSVNDDPAVPLRASCAHVFYCLILVSRSIWDIRAHSFLTGAAWKSDSRVCFALATTPRRKELKSERIDPQGRGNTQVLRE